LRSEEATNFYNDIPKYAQDKYLELGLALHIFSTDREFRRIHAKQRQEDWTK
jgi:hypothetical protein